MPGKIVIEADLNPEKFLHGTKEMLDAIHSLGDRMDDVGEEIEEASTGYSDRITRSARAARDFKAQIRALTAQAKQMRKEIAEADKVPRPTVAPFAKDLKAVDEATERLNELREAKQAAQDVRNEASLAIATKKDANGNKLTAAEIETARQQVRERDEEIQELTRDIDRVQKKLEALTKPVRIQSLLELRETLGEAPEEAMQLAEAIAQGQDAAKRLDTNMQEIITAVQATGYNDFNAYALAFDNLVEQLDNAKSHLADLNDAFYAGQRKLYTMYGTEDAVQEDGGQIEAI